MPSSELQRRVINKVNHTKIDDGAYDILKEFDVHAKKVRVGGRVLAATGFALDLLELLETMHMDWNEADRKLGKASAETFARLVGSWTLSSLGAKGGAVIGAQIGTAIFPGVGTVIGGAAGALVLGIAGSYGGGKLGEYVIDITEVE